MRGSSPLLYGRQLCVIIAVIILLFLPLKFNANNINDRALAQTPHCDASGPDYDVEWCLYEMIGLK